jgi:hypothetical protein
VITRERQQIKDIALVTYSTPRRRNDALAAPLDLLGIEVVLIGDCKSPRDMIAATSDGHLAGHQV